MKKKTILFGIDLASDVVGAENWLLKVKTFEGVERHAEGLHFVLLAGVQQDHL